MKRVGSQSPAQCFALRSEVDSQKLPPFHPPTPMLPFPCGEPQAGFVCNLTWYSQTGVEEGRADSFDCKSVAAGRGAGGCALAILRGAEQGHGATDPGR